MFFVLVTNGAGQSKFYSLIGENVPLEPLSILTEAEYVQTCNCVVRDSLSAFPPQFGLVLRQEMGHHTRPLPTTDYYSIIIIPIWTEITQVAPPIVSCPMDPSMAAKDHQCHSLKGQESDMVFPQQSSFCSKDRQDELLGSCRSDNGEGLGWLVC